MANVRKEVQQGYGPAKALSKDQIEVVVTYLEKKARYPTRDICMFLFSCMTGCRALEISLLEWSMVYDLDGNISNQLFLPAHITKGGKGERTIPMNKQLCARLIRHHEYMKPDIKHRDRLFLSERGYKFDSQKVASFFWLLYRKLGFHKCSSHSGRRTFITNAARKIMKAGGSLKDIQDMAGHKSIATTELYIEINEGAKRRVVEML